MTFTNIFIYNRIKVTRKFSSLISLNVITCLEAKILSIPALLTVLVIGLTKFKPNLPIKLFNKLLTTCLELPLNSALKADNSCTYSIKELFCFLN